MKFIKLILILILLIFVYLELFTDYAVNKWLKAVSYCSLVILLSIELIMRKK